MKKWTLVLRSMRFYVKRNALLSLGIAISTAVLTGSLIVGDSVSHSLQRIVDHRLGNITHALNTGDRYITLPLAQKLDETLEGNTVPALMLDGIAVSGGGQRRLPGVQVIGVNGRFDRMAGTDSLYASLDNDEVVISENLADRLNVTAGDEFLLRMTRLSLVPLNAPFVSDADQSVSVRVTVTHVASISELGAFNLKNSQTAPLNLFISLSRLNEIMELEARANYLFFDQASHLAGEILSSVKDNWSNTDAGLTFQYDTGNKLLEIKSERVFIDSVTAHAVNALSRRVKPVLTYFVNALSHDEKSTPYSFVSTLPDSVVPPGKIIVNDWLAGDIDVKPGDQVGVRYYSVGLLRELETRERNFEVLRVVPMTGIYGDEGLMPDIPGLSDAGNCRDWDTGVPVSLDRIRDKDEEYWDDYSGTPKAFIAESVAAAMWENRFGKYTSFRVTAGPDDVSAVKQEILSALDPAALGFNVSAVREESKFAASNGVDFSELFAGLSFFLLAGAVLLSVLLFKLNLEERGSQVETLSALGISRKAVQQILLREGMLVALAGALPGLLLAVLYNNLVFSALNGIWQDIVRTDMLVPHVRAVTLVYGLLASMLIALPAIYFPLRNYLRSRVNIEKKKGRVLLRRTRPGWLLALALVALAVALVLIVLQFTAGAVVNEGIFFVAGGLLLVAGMVFSFYFLLAVKNRSFFIKSLSGLGVKNTLRNTTRSLTIIVLFAIGTFLVISTGSNRKDLFKNATEKSGGTGGFLYYAESTVPVLKDLSKEDVRFDYGLSDGYEFTQLRVADGDDASCLNLNRITNPRILGVEPEALRGRFSFVTRTRYLDEDDPWLSLGQTLTDASGVGEVIPAIADETVIKWGLGMSVGDTLVYHDADDRVLKLLLIGGLAPSVFQGNVLISEAHFVRNYPASSGTEVFLVDGPADDTATIANELSRGMRDLGWQMQYAPARLAEFNSITNTYLSIFLVMGALGLLLGTMGLAVVLFRSVIERREELAVMRALGFRIQQLRNMLFGEYVLLLIAGTLIGAVSAIVATLPALLSENSDIEISFVLLIVAGLIVNGVAWIWIIAQTGLRRKQIIDAIRSE